MVERVAAEVVEPPCGAQGAVVGCVGLRDAVQLERAAYAADVERGVVGHEHGALFDVFRYFGPHLRELGRPLRVLRPYAVYLHVTVAVHIARRAYEPRARLRNAAVAHNADARLAHGGAPAGGRLEVDGYEVQSLNGVPFCINAFCRQPRPCMAWCGGQAV